MAVDVRRAARRLWELPGKLMLATILLCLALREWYPFSPFPMYANFGPTAWYVCVTDADGEPLAADRYFGLDATLFRRVLETRVLERVAAGEALDRAESGAASDTLAFLVREAHPQPGTPALPSRVGLQRVVVSLDGQRVQRTHELLAVREVE